MAKEYNLSDDKLWDKINNDFQNKGGVYQLFYKGKGKVRPIGRFLGIDHEGILYIGKATRFLDRIIELKKTIDPQKKSASHICGRRYNKSENIRKEFPFKNLFVRLIENSQPEKTEKELLNDYFTIFGEVPPLNANG